MGNTICSCNNKPESKDVNMFSNLKDQDSNTKNAKSGNKTHIENIKSSVYSFMQLLKVQRAVRNFIKLKNKVKYNREGGEGRELQKNDMFKKTGFDDKNFTYNGEYENGNKQGFGIQTWKDGAVYTGYFYENKANFLGIFEHSDGDIYRGEFKEDRACGYGLYQHANGASYEGYWVDDTQHGLGMEIWTDKSEYRGEYFRGKKCGIGSYQWSDGSSYEGEWYDNTLHGFVRTKLIILKL